MNVARLGNSFNVCDPVYVQADRRPPSISSIVSFTSPLYGTSTALPSAALQIKS